MFIAPHLVDLARHQAVQDAVLSQSPLVVYFSTVSALSQSMAPARGAARASAEAVGYMSRRTLATIDSAHRISRCRSPKDLLDEQMRFWNTAMQQYMDATTRMMSAWSQSAAVAAPVAVPVVELSVVASNAEPVRPQPVRDILQLQDAKSGRANRPVTPGTDREAA